MQRFRNFHNTDQSSGINMTNRITVKFHYKDALLIGKYLSPNKLLNWIDVKRSVAATIYHVLVSSYWYLGMHIWIRVLT